MQPEEYRFYYDRSEASKCLLCHDPECSKACPQDMDVGSILRSLYLKNFLGVKAKLNACALPVTRRAKKPVCSQKRKSRSRSGNC